MEELEPLALFLYSIKSDETKRKYANKLEIFFEFAGLSGTLEEMSKQFVDRGRSDGNWAFNAVMRFISHQKERVQSNEIVAGTMLNYYKPVKLFCDLNEINLNWKKISRGLPRGRKYSSDRAPTVEEIRALVEYPDRRIKPIVYTMCSQRDLNPRFCLASLIRCVEPFEVNRKGRVLDRARRWELTLPLIYG